MNRHMLRAGDPSNPSLEKIHGYPANAMLWRRMRADLSKRFYVIAPDLTGWGRSDKFLGQPYDIDSLRGF